ncbi:MAG: hypothetical protein EBU05_09260 [Chitinophagia bacterium]|nr:hypothetical protein [Chitinophagia bacterium]
MTSSKSDWDLDLRYGQDGEESVRRLLTIDTVEVKRDRRWKETGNLYIETSCYCVNDGTFKPSGVSVSKATHFAFVIEDLTILVSKSDLINTVKEYGRNISCNIEPNVSFGYLITIDSLLKWQVEKAERMDFIYGQYPL